MTLDTQAIAMRAGELLRGPTPGRPVDPVRTAALDTLVARAEAVSTARRDSHDAEDRMYLTAIATVAAFRGSRPDVAVVVGKSVSNLDQRQRALRREGRALPAVTATDRRGALVDLDALATEARAAQDEYRAACRELADRVAELAESHGVTLREAAAVIAAAVPDVPVSKSELHRWQAGA